MAMDPERFQAMVRGAQWRTVGDKVALPDSTATEGPDSPRLAEQDQIRDAVNDYMWPTAKSPEPKQASTDITYSIHSDDTGQPTGAMAPVAHEEAEAEANSPEPDDAGLGILEQAGAPPTSDELPLREAAPWYRRPLVIAPLVGGVALTALAFIKIDHIVHDSSQSASFSGANSLAVRPTPIDSAQKPVRSSHAKPTDRASQQPELHKTAEPAAPSSMPAIIAPPTDVAQPQKHHKKQPVRHKVAVPLSPLRLVHQLSSREAMGLLSTVVVPDIDQVLPSYKTAPGSLDMSKVPLGGLVLDNIQPGQEGLLESAVQEVKNTAVVPLESTYADSADGTPESSLELASLQRMFKDGTTLAEAKSLFAKHYKHLADSGVQSVYISADLPTAYGVRVKQKDGTKVIRRHHHKHRVAVYKWVTETRTINQQEATQYLLAKVRAAQAAGLHVVAGAFPGETSSSNNTDPYALVQQLGADIEVSSATPANTDQAAATTASAYTTLRNLNADTTILTAPLQSPDGSAKSLADLAVKGVVAGANQAIVELPASVTVDDYLAASGKLAEQAIANHKLTRRQLDQRVLAHLAMAGVSAKTAVTSIDPHAKTMRHRWERSKP